MERERLAAFLRSRREALQPQDAGLPRGLRRRTAGLRREEVALLSDLSVDYYTRLEQPRGPHPSEQALAAVARGLRLTVDERDHLFRLGGFVPPRRGVTAADHVNPGMMRVFDGLADAAALVVNGVGETLRQTALARALLGDDSVRRGLERSPHYRWFTDPGERALYPPEDHDDQGRMVVAHLLAACTRDGASSRAGDIVTALHAASPGFAELWRQQPVAGPYCAPRRLLHPLVGRLDLHCQQLVDPDQSQSLLVYTAAPGSETYQKLDLLSVVTAS
ncbi:helix-turn-helix transcriptional regulator [Actinoplanes sp. L3-i22]|uniref:helix-turn-helix transcriptional regulator n=1 Tax=Actinoplanes sp. L3-i22 TaxID=2836373 RepID=UPI001C74A670|nr:helix-turn-helix transcriptional regulator [Actinoplanes sp. L3-i22]BCY09513.1 DNA-binding protein [Actinoplanes sp. L3-i22]